MGFLPDNAALAPLFEGALTTSGGARPRSAILRFEAGPATARVASVEAGASWPPIENVGRWRDENTVATGGSLEVRVGAVVEWLLGSTGAFAAFVADPEGLPLANRLAPESYVAATAALGRVHRELGRFVEHPPEGGTILELHGGNWLQLVWVETAAGKLVVGLVLAEPLGRELVPSIRQALRRAVETKEGAHGPPEAQ